MRPRVRACACVRVYVRAYVLLTKSVSVTDNRIHRGQGASLLINPYFYPGTFVDFAGEFLFLLNLIVSFMHLLRLVVLHGHVHFHSGLCASHRGRSASILTTAVPAHRLGAIVIVVYSGGMVRKQIANSGSSPELSTDKESRRFH